jgi:hypothetical protein
MTDAATSTLGAMAAVSPAICSPATPAAMSVSVTATPMRTTRAHSVRIACLAMIAAITATALVAGQLGSVAHPAIHIMPRPPIAATVAAMRIVPGRRMSAASPALPMTAQPTIAMPSAERIAGMARSTMAPAVVSRGSTQGRRWAPTIRRTRPAASTPSASTMIESSCSSRSVGVNDAVGAMVVKGLAR